MGHCHAKPTLADVYRIEWSHTADHAVALVGLIAAGDGDAYTLSIVHDYLRQQPYDVDRVERYMALAWWRCTEQMTKRAQS